MHFAVFTFIAREGKLHSLIVNILVTLPLMILSLTQIMKEYTMPEPTTHSDCHDHYGRAADHLAYESMTTPKDTIAAIGALGNRNGDSFNALERSVENNKSIVGGLVTDSSFRALEQFGIASIRNEKLAAATDVLVQKTSGESLVDSAKNAAAAMLQAEKIASAAAMAAAHCCCELKALILAESCETRDRIRTDGEKTRDLVSTIERESQAVKLVDCKIEVSNLNQDARFRAMLAESKVK